MTLTLLIPVSQSHPHPVEWRGVGGASKHDTRLNLHTDHIHCNTFQKYTLVVVQIKMHPIGLGYYLISYYLAGPVF